MHRTYDVWFRSRLTKRYGRQEAEELSQEAWARLASFVSTGYVQHPKALLLTIAGRIAIDRGRQARRRGELLGHAVARPVAEEGGQAEAVLIRQVILSLPQPLRDVFLLSRAKGLSNSEIAEQLGISPKTVEARMTRAMAHCAAQLRR